ncbi:MAG: oligosaccharyl transferase, archaeosortase A system-associated [Dehalococcoidia bacterium]|nr:oligosaccharyl transferase, archaeosortase A system-associated [Dehalococcoidia bacterium]
MSQTRFSPKLAAAIIVALFFGVALYLRIVLPYDQVFSGEWIKFTGVDAYFYMRIVDNLIHNFPHLNSFDPYMLYPSGAGIGGGLFFDYLLAGIIWLIGLGSPTQHTIDVVGVYFPAVLGALTVIPVYFIGKELFNRWAGVISAGLVALLPGEFLGRSILGFADHHVAETLFSTVVILFLILAIKASRGREITFDHLWHKQWTTITKPLIYSLLAGIFLGIYFLTWQGALLFVFIIFAYLIIQFIIDHLRGRATDYLCFAGTTTFIIALLMFLSTSPDKMLLASLVIAIFIPIALTGLSRLIASRGIRPFFYPIALLGLGLASLAIFYIINPSLLKTMMGLSIGIFRWPIGTTVLEMQPLFFPGGELSLRLAWGNFTTGFFLSFISLGILIYFIVKRGEADKTLLVVWSLVMLAATLSMRRFAYYFVVNVALLTGYLSWLILEFTGFKRLAAKPVETPRIGKKGKARAKKRGITASHVYMAFGIVVVFFLSFFPNISPAVATASQARFAPSDAWCESLSWLRDNTPEPFGDPDFYYELYEPPVPGEAYSYPETAYGVTAWWDYGYWITRLGRRIPTSNPGTGHFGESLIFAAQDEASANKIMDKYRAGSRYVIVDYAIAMWADKFHAVATLSGSSEEEFYDVYYQPQEGELKPVILFYPEYYRSLVIRLYNFDGSQVTPQSSMVISYQGKISREGKTYKEITSAQSFPSYEEAEAYISSQQSDNYRVVGTHPFISPVPLAALEHYKLIHSSDSRITQPGVGAISEVKIFEYVR